MIKGLATLPFFAFTRAGGDKCQTDVELKELMLKLKRKVMAGALAVGAIVSPVMAMSSLDEAIQNYINESEESPETEAQLTALEAILDEISNPLSEVQIKPEEVATEQRWVGSGFTDTETAVLNFFQDYGIKDRAALAVLLGNVKQESRFVTNICEGGARVAYQHCHRGGYGLIQWTTQGRYDGLGRHARQVGASPTDLNTQLSYITTEVEWQKVEHIFRTEGRSIASYMQAAYRWLGWGIHGARTSYAQDYYNRLSLG